MSGYRGYRLTLAPASSFLTPLQSDTLFGHLCWALRYLDGDGEVALGDFLASYDNGAPPMLLSAAFPAGMLPRPLLPMRDAERREVIRSAYGDEGPEAMRRGMAAFKRIAAVEFLDIDVLKKWVDRLSAKAVARLFFDLQLCPRCGLAPEKLGCPATFETCGIFWERHCSLKDFEELEQRTTITRNTINRQRWVTTEGAASLYTHDEVYYVRDREVWLWLAQGQDIAVVQDWFEWVGERGFGKRASVGRGQFRVTAVEEMDNLPRSQQPNAFMILSAWVPCTGEPATGWYRLVVKRGKLGSAHITNLQGVWKQPLLMLAPGSVFLEESPNDYYGRMVHNVHRGDDRVVQYGYGVTLHLNIKDLS